LTALSLALDVLVWVQWRKPDPIIRCLAVCGAS